MAIHTYTIIEIYEHKETGLIPMRRVFIILEGSDGDKFQVWIDSEIFDKMPMPKLETYLKSKVVGRVSWANNTATWEEMSDARKAELEALLNTKIKVTV